MGFCERSFPPFLPSGEILIASLTRRAPNNTPYIKGVLVRSNGIYQEEYICRRNPYMKSGGITGLPIDVCGGRQEPSVEINNQRYLSRLEKIIIFPR